MAYMNQEKKKVIANKLKSIVPKSWKYSLGVRHHSSIVCIIRKGPAFNYVKYDKDDKAYITTVKDGDNFGLNNIDARFFPRKNTNLNTIKNDTKNKGIYEILKKIESALNTDNFDNSDLMTDYFSVGHYVNFSIGEWDKPYTVFNKKELTK